MLIVGAVIFGRGLVPFNLLVIITGLTLIVSVIFINSWWSYLSNHLEQLIGQHRVNRLGLPDNSCTHPYDQVTGAYAGNGMNQFTCGKCGASVNKQSHLFSSN
jgi:hypothetical protein